MKIINVMASSIDGCIAAYPGESDSVRVGYNLTNPDDQDFVRKQIEEADAIITGASSLRASQTLRKEKNKNGNFPLWVIFSKEGLDPQLPFWQQNEFDRWVVSPGALPMHAKAVKNLVYGSEDAAPFVRKKLQDAGINTALLFGGGFINGLFYRANLVDELRLTLGPVILGAKNSVKFINFEEGEQLPNPTTLQLQSVDQKHDHLYLTYKVEKPLV